MFDNMKKVNQGSVGLGMAIAYFTMENYIVCLPLNDNQAYDLIVEKDRKLQRVEVKTTGSKGKDFFTVQLRSIRPNRTTNKIRNFDPDSSDLLFILTSNSDMYLIPSKEINCKSTMCLNETKEKWKIKLRKRSEASEDSVLNTDSPKGFVRAALTVSA